MVTPSRNGYIFANQQELHQCNCRSHTYQNYTAIPLYSISGNTGVAGVTLSYTDNTPATVTSQPSGSYSFTVPRWGGMVTPTHPCFTFSPDSREYISINADCTTENYTPSFNSGAGCSDITAQIGGVNQGRFGLEPGASTRASLRA